MPSEDINQLSSMERDIDKRFKELIEPYRSDLWKYCYRLTGSVWDAEDLVQETLLKSLSMLAKVFQPIHAKAYLFKIASNTWIDQMRKRHLVTDPYHDTATPDNRPESEFNVLENVEWLLKQLTPKQYVALVLGDVFQYTAKEIGEIIHSTEGAVHTSLSRARSILKDTAIDIDGEIQTQYRTVQFCDSTIDTMLEGFRKKNPNIIAALLDENVVTDIVHAGYEMGAEETRKNSLNDWEEIALSQEEIVVEYVELWEKRVIVEMERKTDNLLYLTNVHEVEMEDGKITYWKFYCFSWDLMSTVADALGVRMNAEYFYHTF